MSDDFLSLRPITIRPVALNPEAWDLESESLDSAPTCYLCHISENDPDANLHNAGLPQSSLWVCERCEGSYRHQVELREAWLAEESGV